jgi:hypothetical protein
MYKLFVGGISQETTEMDLRSHFSKFGTITKASIIYDKRTSRLSSADASKGFGFIESDNRKTIERIFEVKVHFLKGRYVDVNRALDKDSQVPSDIVDRGFKKLFVGGLSSDTTDDDLFEYYSSFAPVFKAYVIYDPNTRESKSRRRSPRFRLCRVRVCRSCTERVALWPTQSPRPTADSRKSEERTPQLIEYETKTTSIRRSRCGIHPRIQFKRRPEPYPTRSRKPV